MAAETRFLKDDYRWMRQMFMTDPSSFDDFLRAKQTATSNFYKYEDTTLGGHRTMNPPPQYTRFADPKGDRLIPDVSRGMGDYYSEAIDDNARVISIRYGTPEYTGLVTFFSSFYNSDAGMLVRTGHNGGLVYTLGKMAGYVAVLPFLPFIVVGQTVKALAGTPSTRFYYLRPNMPIYWNAVQSFVNRLSVNMGIGVPQFNSELAVAKDGGDGMPLRDEKGNVVYDDVNFDIPSGQFDQYQKLLPNLWNANGGIDIYALANRAQRLSNVWNEHLAQIAADTSVIDDETWRQELMSYPGKTHREMMRALKGTPLSAAMENWVKTPQGQKKPGDAEADNQRGDLTKDAGIFSRLVKYGEAEARDGSQFVSFYVHEAGTASESFSNSTRNTDLGEKFNSISSGVRQARINLADGNTGMALVDTAIAAAKDFLQGAADGIQMSGLVGLAGNALTDIPKVWDSSSANLPRMDYTLQLRTPYGNKVSRLQNLLIPLAMILVGGLPRSTGPQSYGSPFLAEVYDKGHAQSRLCMMDSITVTRGVGNVGWTQEDEPLGIDVQFSFVDLSSIMHISLGSSVSPTDLIQPGGLNRAFFGDDTAFTDYLAVLSSMGLADQIYRTRNMARNWRRVKLEFDSYFSVSHAASWFGGTAPGRVISALSNVRANG